MCCFASRCVGGVGGGCPLVTTMGNIPIERDYEVSLLRIVSAMAIAPQLVEVLTEEPS